MIKVESISKSYKFGQEDFWALKNISLEVKDGEFVAILGPSGSGKSTLMHIIGGLDRPTGGKIFVDDEDLSQLTDRKLAGFRNKTVGFVFQTFNLIPRMNVLDNVRLPLIYSPPGKVSSNNRPLEVLSSVGLQTKLKNNPNQLSGGEQQRVAIARALVNEPKIVLADEPTGNLDSKTGEQILQILLSLNKQGKTIILVTHEKTIAKVADKTVVLKDGVIV